MPRAKARNLWPGVLTRPPILPGRIASSGSMQSWRRERDSNPRCPFEHNGFQDRRFQPLTHPSAGWELHLFHQFIANSIDVAFCRSCTLFAHSPQQKFSEEDTRELKSLKGAKCFLRQKVRPSGNNGGERRSHCRCAWRACRGLEATLHDKPRKQPGAARYCTDGGRQHRAGRFGVPTAVSHERQGSCGSVAYRSETHQGQYKSNLD